MLKVTLLHGRIYTYRAAYDSISVRDGMLFISDSSLEEEENPTGEHYFVAAFPLAVVESVVETEDEVNES